jgi:ribosome-binding protein aMBF1 (putative translation factor)
LRIGSKAGQRGFASYSEYREYMAGQKGFASDSEYKTYLSKERQRKLENKTLSSLIKKRLRELGENQSWLAREINVTRASVSNYAHGKYTPSRKILERLYSALEIQPPRLEDKIPYQKLENLLD